MSSVHQLGVQSSYLRMIRSGKKNVEGRIAKSKYGSFRPGDTLEFRSEDEILVTKIVELKHFSSFEQMLNHYGVQACLPDLDSVEEAVKVYRSFPNYAEQESIYGVMGIKICLDVTTES